jgi:hypothetical protein
MNKFNLFLAIGILSLLLMGVAVINPFSGNSSSDLSDYYFRQQALKRTGSDLTDYYFRHNL